MKQLFDFKEEIHKCSKCGLCQAECPIYRITGNDCAVSRGQFVMLNGIVKGDLKMSKTINRYLDLCLKCGKCSKFCPSGIDVVDIIVAAKQEYFKTHPLERVKTLFLKLFVFGLIPRIVSLVKPSIKSKKFDKKVLYFGGCGSKFKGDSAVVKVLNSVGVEVINPKFNCCGVPYFTRGDLGEFKNSINDYVNLIKKYNIKNIVTTCASCEKTLNDYIKWADNDDAEFLKDLEIKSVYEYLYDEKLKLKLNKNLKITYHKPCNLLNFEPIDWLLNNVENLDYVKMEGYDSCCGLNGLSKIKEFNIMSKIFKDKRKNIINAKADFVATSCLGCEIALKAYSFNNYEVADLLDLIGNNV